MNLYRNPQTPFQQTCYTSTSCANVLHGTKGRTFQHSTDYQADRENRHIRRYHQTIQHDTTDQPDRAPLPIQHDIDPPSMVPLNFHELCTIIDEYIDKTYKGETVYTLPVSKSTKIAKSLRGKYNLSKEQIIRCMALPSTTLQ